MPRLFEHCGGTIIDARQKPVTYFADHIAAETAHTKLLADMAAAREAGEVERVAYLIRAQMDLRAALAAHGEWRRAATGFRRAA